ncbi:MAG: adenosine deaminase family protein [Acidobacteriota bacterium]
MASPLSRELIQQLPKTDLHVHLDGSLRLGTLVELAQQQNVELPSYTEEGLLEKVFKEKYQDLPDYLRGFAYTCAVMRDPESLERIAYELAQDSLAEGVRYVEVRFAPQLHVHDRLSLDDVLSSVNRGLERAQQEHEATEAVASGKEPPFRYAIIACAMRMFTEAFSPYHADLISVLDKWPQSKIHGAASLSLARSVVDARDRLGLPVTGFDLAGAEAGNPASDHVEAYQFAHRRFLKKTVHAGEAYGPESIFQAITLLYADRIGHGTRLYKTDEVDAADPQRYVDQLVEFISDRRITLEVCVTSNLQTMPELRGVEDHPIGRMIKDRLSIVLSTDNRLVSRTSVTEEFVKVCDAFEITDEELRNMMIYGFKRSFFPGTYQEKRAYVRQIIDYYDDVIEQA